MIIKRILLLMALVGFGGFKNCISKEPANTPQSRDGITINPGDGIIINQIGGGGQHIRGLRAGGNSIGTMEISHDKLFMEDVKYTNLQTGSIINFSGDERSLVLNYENGQLKGTGRGSNITVKKLWCNQKEFNLLTTNNNITYQGKNYPYNGVDTFNIKGDMLVIVSESNSGTSDDLKKSLMDDKHSLKTGGAVAAVVGLGVCTYWLLLKK